MSGSQVVNAELEVAIGLWKKLDDREIIKDVVMKGKLLTDSIEFMASRRNVPQRIAKDFFFETVADYVDTLIRETLLHRALRVLDNIKADEQNYLFDFYEVCKQSL